MNTRASPAPPARICILLPYHYDAARGGSEYRARLLAEHLARRSDIEVVYLTRHAPEGNGNYPYRIREFKGPELLQHPRWGNTPDAIALHRALEDIEPDVIVQFVACAYTGIAAWYARAHEKRLVWCLSSDMDVEILPNVGVGSPLQHLDRLLFRYGVRNAACIIAQTNAQAENLQANFNRTVSAVVPNFHPLINHAVHKVDPFTVLWVGNIKTHKRPELFLDLVETFAARDDIRFRMIGRPQSNQWCDAIVQRAADLPNLDYLGELEMEEVNRELEAAHLFVSTSEYEGMPNTFIQAWLREVPTLSLDVDPDGVIAREGLGLVTSDLQLIESRISELSADRDALQEIGKRARTFAEATYSLRNLERFEEVIEGAILESRVVSAAGP